MLKEKINVVEKIQGPDFLEYTSDLVEEIDYPIGCKY